MQILRIKLLRDFDKVLKFFIEQLTNYQIQYNKFICKYIFKKKKISKTDVIM